MWHHELPKDRNCACPHVPDVDPTVKTSAALQRVRTLVDVLQDATLQLCTGKPHKACGKAKVRAGCADLEATQHPSKPASSWGSDCWWTLHWEGGQHCLLWPGNTSTKAVRHLLHRISETLSPCGSDVNIWKSCCNLYHTAFLSSGESFHTRVSVAAGKMSSPGLQSSLCSLTLGPVPTRVLQQS